MLTTIDNPFNPKENYKAWNLWDIDNGYNTASYLARILQNFRMVDDEWTQESIDEAQNIIIDNDMLGVYLII